LIYCNKIKITQYHTGRTDANSNRKIVEIKAKSIPICMTTQHPGWVWVLQRNGGGINLILWAKTSLLLK
jgi:hypothetical protein